MSIKNQVLKKFCDQTKLHPAFIERLAVLYNGLGGNERGLSPEEWEEYREKSRRFTDQMIQWLLKQKEKETDLDEIQGHKGIIMGYVNWRSQISAPRTTSEETLVTDYLREFYVPYEPEIPLTP